jgi:hypothetical protein
VRSSFFVTDSRAEINVDYRDVESHSNQIPCDVAHGNSGMEVHVSIRF